MPLFSSACAASTEAHLQLEFKMIKPQN